MEKNVPPFFVCLFFSVEFVCDVFMCLFLTFPIFLGMGKYLVIPKLPGSLQPALFLVERGQETHQLVNRRRRE